MAGGRRCPVGRNSSSARMPINSNNNNSSSNHSNAAAPLTSSYLSSGVYGVDDRKGFVDHMTIGRTTLAPKHVPIPTIPTDGQLLFESMSLAMSVVTASLQLLNLYKTVWWLPQSYNEYSMNFYLMDHYVLLLILIMSSRQFVYALLCRSLGVITPPRWLSLAQRAMRLLLLLLIMAALFWCLYHINERHNLMKVFYLCYPIFIYFLMFGPSIGPFFDINTAPLYIKEDRKTKFILDKPLHNCSLNTSAVRAEVASLKSDFNRRLKRALFASSGSAYLCGILPVIFVPPHLHFDVSWVVQYIVLIWLGRLGAHFTQAYPVRYCDVLHRAALHLGKWSKVESKNVHIPYQPWNDTILWPHGSLVKHNKETYRSEGLCTAAEPGNISHQRFYALFGNPTILQCSLMCLVLSLIAIQLTMLVHTTEWYKILSMSLLIVTNYYTLFRLARDYLVCWKVYRAEQIVQEKTQIALANNAQ